MAKRSKRPRPDPSGPAAPAPLEDLSADVQAIRDLMEYDALYLLPAFTFDRSGSTFYLLQPYPEKIAPGHDYAKLHRMFCALCLAGEIILVKRRNKPFPSYERHLPILVHGTFLVFRADWGRTNQRLFEITTLTEVIGGGN